MIRHFCQGFKHLLQPYAFYLALWLCSCDALEQFVSDQCKTDTNYTNTAFDEHAQRNLQKSLQEEARKADGVNLDLII